MYEILYVRMYIRTYVCTNLSDDNEHDATPLIKPASDPDISATVTTTTTGSNKYGMKWLKHKAMNFCKAFCIPGVVVVRYGCVFMYLLVPMIIISLDDCPMCFNSYSMLALMRV